MSPVVTVLSSSELSVAFTCHASSVSLLQSEIAPQSSFHTPELLVDCRTVTLQEVPQFRFVWDLLEIKCELCVFGRDLVCLVTDDVHFVVFSKLLNDKLLLFLFD